MTLPLQRTRFDGLQRRLGGLLLGDGANVCPGTPVENLAALSEAAEEYGLPRLDAG